MSSELELAIQGRLLRYLASVESLEDFENWFTPVLWDVDNEDRDTRELAGTVHILISEFSRGDRTLQQLHDGLLETIRMAGENEVGTSTSVSESNATSVFTSIAA
jgi:hypothetical protein